MPALSKAWEELKDDDNEIDPIALAKSLAQTDMLDDDDDDEDKSQGKGKGNMV